MTAPRPRAVLAGTLAVLACVALLASILAVWAGRTVLNTDRFTAAVDSSLDDPVVEDALAEWISEQVDSVIDEAAIAEQILPDDFQALAPLVDRALTRFANEEVSRLVRSERVHDLVVDGARRAHTVVIKVLEGDRPEGGFVVVEDGKVDLNLLPVVGLALDRAQGVSLLSGVDLPEITPDMTVEEQNAALSDALGTDLRPDLGQLTIYERDAGSTTSVVGAAQQALSLFRATQLLLLAATILLGTLAVLAATDRLRMGTWLAFGAFVVVLVAWIIIRRVTDAAPTIITDADARATAEAVIGNVVGNLDRTVTLLAFLALVLLAVLLAWGWLSRRPDERARLQALVARRADLVRAGGVILAVLLLVVLGLSVVSFLMAVAIGVAGWVLPLAGDGDEVGVGGRPEEG